MVTDGYHLAQVNIARATAPLDSPQMADFMAALDRINALAETQPGFVWRLKSESGNATDIQVFDDPQMIINMSVWQSIEALFDFTYQNDHTAIMARRRHWFDKMSKPHLALWWVPIGHQPGVDEAKARLWLLESLGPTRDAFTFKQRFDAPVPATLETA